MNKTTWATLIALAILCAFGGRAAAQEPDDAEKRRVPYYYGQPPYWPNGSYNPSTITVYGQGYGVSRYPTYITPPVYYQRYQYVPLSGYAPGPIYYPYAPVNPAAAGYYWRR